MIGPTAVASLILNQPRKIGAHKRGAASSRAVL